MKVLSQDSLKLDVAEDNFDQSFLDVGQALYQPSCITSPKHHT